MLDNNNNKKKNNNNNNDNSFVMRFRFLCIGKVKELQGKELYLSV